MKRYIFVLLMVSSYQIGYGTQTSLLNNIVKGCAVTAVTYLCVQEAKYYVACFNVRREEQNREALLDKLAYNQIASPDPIAWRHQELTLLERKKMLMQKGYPYISRMISSLFKILVA